MYRIGPLGCLFSILWIWLFFTLKLYYLVFGVLILIAAFVIFFICKNKYKVHIENKEKSFEPEIGEVYKICPYCNNDVKRSTKICPHCKSELK